MDFDNAKKRVLTDLVNGIDFSPKGSIDAPIAELVNLLNGFSNYLTTSSCSGRISVYLNDNATKGVRWLFVQHGVISIQNLKDSILKLPDSSQLVFLKCEAFILHIQCRDIDSARSLHEIAISSGFRESGLSISSKKIMLAVRTTAFFLELPIAIGNIFLMDYAALNIIINEANSRLMLNFQRIDRFLMSVKRHFQWPTFYIKPNINTSTSISQKTPSEHLNLSRWGHSCVKLKCGRIMIVGGYGNNKEGNPSRNLISLRLLVNDGNKIQFEEMTGSYDPYMHAAAAPWGDGMVVIGGRSSPTEKGATYKIRVCGPDMIFKEVPDEYIINSPICISDERSGGGVGGGRWGHTLTPLSSNTYLLVGGRNESQVFDESYILQWIPPYEEVDEVVATGGSCTSTSTTTTTADLSTSQKDSSWTNIHYGIWRWDLVNSSGSNCTVGPRFFHAACAIPISEAEGDIAVVVIGGLSSLSDSYSTHYNDNDEAASHTAMVWYPISKDTNNLTQSDDNQTNITSKCSHNKSRSRRSTIRGAWFKVSLTTAPGDNNIHDKPHNTSSYSSRTTTAVPFSSTSSTCIYDELNGVFGHTLTYLGGKSLLLLGGTSLQHPLGSLARFTCIIDINGWNTTCTSSSSNEPNHDYFQEHHHSEDITTTALPGIIHSHSISSDSHRNNGNNNNMIPSSSSNNTTSTTILSGTRRPCLWYNDVSQSAVASITPPPTTTTAKIPCEHCRIHHQTIVYSHSFSTDSHSTAKMVVALGGGAPCLSFGPHYCSSLLLEQIPSDNNSICNNNNNNNNNNIFIRKNTKDYSISTVSRNDNSIDSVPTKDIASNSIVSELSKDGPVLIVPLSTVKSIKTYLENKTLDSCLTTTQDSVHHPLTVSPWFPNGSMVHDTPTSHYQKKSKSKMSVSGNSNSGWLDKSRRISAYDDLEGEKDVELLVFTTAYTTGDDSTNQLSNASSDNIMNITSISISVSEETNSTHHPRHHPTVASIDHHHHQLSETNSIIAATTITTSTTTTATTGLEKGIVYMAIPIISEVAVLLANNTSNTALLQELSPLVNFQSFALCLDYGTRLSKSLVVSSKRKAHDFLQQVTQARNMSSDALTSIPRKYELVGDILMIPGDAFSTVHWDWLSVKGKGTERPSDDAIQFWTSLASCFSVSRVARHAAVDSGPKRESRIRLLLPPIGLPESTGPGSLGWVSVWENGIRFSFDITRVMFCSGNVTERMRMGRIKAKGKEVLVDLYCGIGYYSIPMLLYGGVSQLHAFEWNENSILSLRHNLRDAKIPPEKYIIHDGDNRIHAITSPMRDIADRVCLGLLPSSEEGWPLAVHVLKPTGGMMHLHMNIKKDEEKQWVVNTCHTFEHMFKSAGKPMSVSCVHLERVKSYAPLVIHVVADLYCIPILVDAS